MPISKKISKHLEDNGLDFEIIKHRKVYTAFDAAKTNKVKLGQIAKSLIVKFNRPFINNQKPYALVIVGADRNIDLDKLSKVVSKWAELKNKELRLKKPEKGKKMQMDIYNKVSKVTIPKEKDLQAKLKIKPATTSAFGSIYKIPVFVDGLFLKQNKAIFSSGDFRESVKMSVKGYVKLENAMEGNFSVSKKFKTPKKSTSKKKKPITRKTVKKPAKKR